ncbi:hypothetical protein GCM10007159_02970 [Modicisalibacter luteus]|nr:hypothetical protein GCM10007159_02970 [Halomonas lutea]
MRTIEASLAQGQLAEPQPMTAAAMPALPSPSDSLPFKRALPSSKGAEPRFDAFYVTFIKF